MGLLFPLLLAVSHVVSPLLSPLFSCTAAACFTWNQNLTSCFSRFVQTIQTVPVAFVIRAYSKMYKHFIYRQGRWQYRSTKYDHSVCKTPEMTQKYNWKKRVFTPWNRLFLPFLSKKISLSTAESQSSTKCRTCPTQYEWNAWMYYVRLFLFYVYYVEIWGLRGGQDMQIDEKSQGLIVRQPLIGWPRTRTVSRVHSILCRESMKNELTTRSLLAVPYWDVNRPWTTIFQHIIYHIGCVRRPSNPKPYTRVLQ